MKIARGREVGTDPPTNTSMNCSCSVSMHGIICLGRTYGFHNLPEWARLSWRNRRRPRHRYPLPTPASRCSRPAMARASVRCYAGELHNHVRMTWGKALTGWTADVEQSMLGPSTQRHVRLGRTGPSSVSACSGSGLFDRPSIHLRILGSSVNETHERMSRMTWERTGPSQTAHRPTPHPIVVSVPGWRAPLLLAFGRPRV